MDTSTESASFRQRIINMPVGRKLFHGFAALTGVLALVIGCLFLTVSRLGTANDQIVTIAAARSEAANHLRFAASELRAAQQAYVLAWPATHQAFDAAAGQFESSLQALREGSGNAVTEALIQKIATGYQTFLQTDQLIWEALQAGQTTLARNLTLGAESLAFGFMADDAASFAAISEGNRADAVKAFHDTSAEARILGVVLGVVALFVMVISSWLITKLIRDPLHRVQQAAELAADGDLDAEADVYGDDETGRLARAFNSNRPPRFSA